MSGLVRFHNWQRMFGLTEYLQSKQNQVLSRVGRVGGISENFKLVTLWSLNEYELVTSLRVGHTSRFTE